MKTFKEIKEGKLDNFDNAYNTWHSATIKMTKAFEKAATDKKAVGKFKSALQAIEDAIDAGNMKD